MCCACRPERASGHTGGPHRRCVGAVHTQLQDAAPVLFQRWHCASLEPGHQVSAPQHLHCRRRSAPLQSFALKCTATEMGGRIDLVFSHTAPPAHLGIGNKQHNMQTHERLKRTVLMRTKHMQIFGVTPFSSHKTAQLNSEKCDVELGHVSAFG